MTFPLRRSPAHVFALALLVPALLGFSGCRPQPMTEPDTGANALSAEYSSDTQDLGSSATSRPSPLEAEAEIQRNPDGDIVSVVWSTADDHKLHDLSGRTAIEQLDLTSSDVTGDGLQQLTGLKDLKELNLANTRVTDDGLSPLGQFEDLERLDLGDLDISDESLQYLEPLSQLKMLSLGGTRVTDQGMQQIAKLKQLRELHLYRTSITDEGLRHLHDLKHLEELNLLFCQNVTEAGVQEFKTALPNCIVTR